MLLDERLRTFRFDKFEILESRFEILFEERSKISSWTRLKMSFIKKEIPLFERSIFISLLLLQCLMSVAKSI